jgi:hypothetical protein
MTKGILSTVLGAMLLFPAVALAQDAPAPDGGQTDATDTATAPANDGTLPAPSSDDDAFPEVATPGVPSGGLVEQAGVGGSTGYGRAGVFELGGAAGLLATSDITSLQIAPQAGWFVADNVQLSAILNINYNKAGSEDSTTFGALVEPSYHLPFNRTMFGFVGVGFGLAYLDGPGAGFATAPRLGANFLVGRSGILTPSLSYQYTTHSIEDAGMDRTLIGVSQAVRANVGYTVML